MSETGTSETGTSETGTSETGTSETGTLGVDHGAADRRGTLRVYLGVAPGVGKTYAMLEEGRRRAARGTDVVVGVVDTHDRPHTSALLAGMEVLAPSVGGRLDLAACLARRPQVLLVDDLARADEVPADTRWSQVEELLDAGIDVISTVDIDAIASLRDVVVAITGSEPAATIPDAVVRRAAQIELVDMAPEALIRRLAHGNVFTSDELDAARSAYFEVETLAGLRELALLWLANWVEEGRRQHSETRERVLVALSGAPRGAALIRRATRLAGRLGGDLIGVHVRSPAEGSEGIDELGAHRQLLGELGGRFVQVISADPASALLSAARSLGATQLVVGSSLRPHRGPFQRPVLGRLIELAGGVDVHVVGAAAAPAASRPRARQRPLPALSRRRQASGWAVAALGVPALTALALALGSHVDLTSVLLAYLTVVLAAALLGGRRPSLGAALLAFVAANWFFTVPVHTFSVANSEDVAALVVFLAVGLTVATLEDRVARREQEARQARTEAETLARATAALAARDPLPALLDVLCSALGILACAVLEPTTDPPTGSWRTVAAAGPEPPASDREPGSSSFPIGRAGTRLVVRSRPDASESGQVLQAVADQLAVALERRELQARAAEAAAIAEADRLRVGLLRSVSHDLRSPLSVIKANVTTLQRRGVDWEPAEVAGLLAAVDRECDRLDRVVGNLLDASRLQAGELRLHLQPTEPEAVIAAAAAHAGAEPRMLRIDAEPTVPLALADAELLERALANVISNAIAWSPPGEAVRVVAEGFDDEVILRVIDRGPGIPAAQRSRVLQPFQRLGDRSRDTGAGLGLAIASGFVTAMGGRFSLGDTPGGGLTVTIAVPQAPPEAFGP